MSKITNMDIIEQVERLAAACPWDTAELWICRKPEGRYTFTAHLQQNDKFGFPCIFKTTDEPSSSVNLAIERAKERDPDKARTAKIAELKAQIEKLQSVVIGMPPYRPGSELTNGEATLTIKETVAA